MAGSISEDQVVEEEELGPEGNKKEKSPSESGDIQSRSRQKWVIVTDPESRFTDLTNPFFVYRERTTLALCASTDTVKKFGNFLGCLAYILPFAFATELVGAYGVTELLPNETALMPLFAALVRIPYYFRLNTDLLGLLKAKYEFWVLIISCIVGTIGLMDAFNYDLRSAVAVDFLTIGTYAACEDAANKYSKRSPSVRAYVFGTFVLYINLSVVLLLIYFGFVPNLNNRTLFVPTFPTNSETLPVNSTTTEETPGFTVGSLNITLGLVQGILIYLFKSPYRLSRNELAILKVPLYAKKVNLAQHGIEERERVDAAARVHRAFTLGTTSEIEMEDEEVAQSQVSSYEGDTSKAMRLAGVDPKKKLYRIAAIRNEFLVAGKPFQWNRADTVGRRLLGERWSTFCFKVLYFNLSVQTIMAVYALTCCPIFFLVLVDVLPKDAAWYTVPCFVLLFVYFNTLNYELLGKDLKTVGVRIMLFLMIIGNCGLSYAFNFDVRTSGIWALSLTFFVFVGLSDARIRSRVLNRYAMFMYTYVFFWFVLTLAFFYVNAIVDIQDAIVTPAELSGRNSTLELSVVGYSLYSLEIVALFLGRKYYSIMFMNGFSALEIRLRYFTQDMQDAVSSPYADAGRISLLIDRRKFSALLPNSKTQTQSTSTSHEEESETPGEALL